MLPFEKLLAFVRVAESGSFTRAAIQLDASHSGLSRHVIELERQLGYRVLYRTGRGVQLTDQGKQLFERASALIREAQTVADEAYAAKGMLTGTVKIGMPGSIALLLASHIFSAVGRKHPSVKIRLVEGLSGSIGEMLSAGRIELGLFYAPHRQTVRNQRAMFHSDLYLVGRAGDPVTAPEEVRFEQISDLNLVLPGQPHAIRSILEDSCPASRISLRVPYEADSLSTMKRVVEDGAGYTITTWDSVRREVEAGSLSAARIVDPVLTRALLLDHSPYHLLSTAARAVLDEVRTLVQALTVDPKYRLRAPSE